MIIDGTNMILGRLATFVAKKAIEGESIDVVNAEKVIITGKKLKILKKFQERRAKGEVHFGPYYPRRADRILKRAIRGMIPYKKKNGREALSRVKCYIGVPEVIKIQEAQKAEGADVSKIKRTNHISLGKLSELLGAKY